MRVRGAIQAPSRWLEFHACAVVENPAPHGARIPSWPCALPGDSIPPPHSVGTGFSLEEGCGNVPHTGSWPFSDRGGISCLDTISCLDPACSRPDWDIRYPLSAFRQVSFCWGAAFECAIKLKMPRRVVQKPKNAPPGSPPNQKCPVG